MKKHIYILTDSNRSCLHVGLTEDILKTMNFYKEKKAIFFDVDSKISRLVYFEEFFTDEQGLERYEQLCRFTRPQKERLIRGGNPDWRDVSQRLYHPGAKFNPKVPAFTSLL